jgi:hypothetical protein
MVADDRISGKPRPGNRSEDRLGSAAAVRGDDKQAAAHPGRRGRAHSAGRQMQVLFYVLWDWQDGKLTEGW